MTTPARGHQRVAHAREPVRSHRGRRAVGVLAVAATLAAGGTLATSASFAQTPNLVVNPGFETGLTGWYAAEPYRVERVTSAHGGDHGARLRNAGDRTRSGALNDVVNTVASTRAGHTYRARAWVRSDTPGLRVAVRLMEYRKSALLGQRAKAVVLPDTDWHRVVVRYDAVSDGATLDLNVVGQSLPAGASVVVDDVKLVDEDGGTAAAPAATATATPTGDATGAAPTASATPTTGSTSTTATSTATSAPAASSSSTTSAPPAPSTTATTATTTAAPAPAGWTLRWSDEFDDGTVDPARWSVAHESTYGDGNSELACLMNRPENVSESGGLLTIRARRESTPVRCGTGDTRFPDGRSYTSGMLRTTQSWTYGRFEVRAKLPTSAGDSKGLWPAFWMRPSGGGTGELDILEAIGSGPGGTTTKKVHHTIWYDYSGTHPKETYTHTTSFDPSAGFHTYAVEWDPGQIRWYVDGALTWTRSTSSTTWLESAFAKPFFVRLNLAVGGTWPGSPDSTTSFPADYSIDYLRVYQRS